MLAILLAASPADAGGLEARWLTQDRDSVIELHGCGAELCGRIVGMSETQRPDGTVLTDVAGHPMCGLDILRVLPDGPGRWSGRVTDPETGIIWNCTLSLDAEGHLKLRGYVLVPVLGQTQTWTRYTGKLGAGCALVP